MENERLDFLKRRNKGKDLLEKYKEIFILAGIPKEELLHVNLEESDKLIKIIRSKFPLIEPKIEMLPKNITTTDSFLLSSVFEKGDLADCYIYSDDVDFCGMYLVNAKTIKHSCLKVAQMSYTNTCFLLDKDLNFSIKINFYDEYHAEHRNQYDIQLREFN